MKTKLGNQFVLKIKNRYTKLKKVIWTSKTDASTVAHIFHEHCVENYGILSKLFTENSPPFVS